MIRLLYCSAVFKLSLGLKEQCLGRTVDLSCAGVNGSGLNRPKSAYQRSVELRDSRID